MQNNAEIKPENKHPHKLAIYREFVRWNALPPFERVQTGITTQEEFAAHYKVNKDTLTRWKERRDFEPRTDELVRSWGLEKTPAVMQGIYNAAVKGSARSQLIWMKYFTTFDPKRAEKLEMAPLVREEDVRMLIQELPEWRQKMKASTSSLFTSEA